MSHGLHDAWLRTVARRGRGRAMVQAADGREVTFAELDALATSWLNRLGTAPRELRGRGVVFAVPNGLRWLEIFLGLLKAGAVAVPMDSAEPPLAQRRLAESLRAGFWWSGDRLIPLAGARRYRGAEISLVKVTSGTTGQPRPLVFTAPQLLADARQIASTMGIRARDLNYALIPFGHSYGLGNLALPLIVQGVPVVCASAALPAAIEADFVRWRPTVFPGVPPVWRALAGSEVRLDSLRLAISAGAPLPPEVARDFAARFGRRLHSFYGSSETGGISYDASGAMTLAGGVGRALRGVKLTPLGGQRLQVRSAAVFTRDNSKRAGRQGCWVMPDRVRIEAKGALTLLGRRGRTVKVGGRRLDLGEVEAALKRLAGVRDVWVGVGGRGEPVLGAAVAAERVPAELRAELLTGHAAWKIPRKLVALAAFPVTARGKTDTRALQAMVFGG